MKSPCKALLAAQMIAVIAVVASTSSASAQNRLVPSTEVERIRAIIADCENGDPAAHPAGCTQSTGASQMMRASNDRAIEQLTAQDLQRRILEQVDSSVRVEIRILLNRIPTLRRLTNARIEATCPIRAYAITSGNGSASWMSRCMFEREVDLAKDLEAIEAAVEILKNGLPY